MCFLKSLIVYVRRNESRKRNESKKIRYSDQWYFLSHVHRFSEVEIDQLIETLSEETELGELSDLSDAEQIKPWDREKKVILGLEDFPLTLTVTLSNGIYIPTQGLSQRALNKMKRLAAFPNPEFYKKQAMRFSTWNTPRIIDCHQEHDGYIQLPRGCFGEMSKLFDQSDKMENTQLYTCNVDPLSFVTMQKSRQRTDLSHIFCCLALRIISCQLNGIYQTKKR